MVGGHAELSTVVVVVAVGCDDGVHLHLKLEVQTIRRWLRQTGSSLKGQRADPSPSWSMPGRRIWSARISCCSFCRRFLRCTVTSLWRNGAPRHHHPSRSLWIYGKWKYTQSCYVTNETVCVCNKKSWQTNSKNKLKRWVNLLKLFYYEKILVFVFVFDDI